MTDDGFDWWWALAGMSTSAVIHLGPITSLIVCGATGYLAPMAVQKLRTSRLTVGTVRSQFTALCMTLKDAAVALVLLMLLPLRYCLHILIMEIPDWTWTRWLHFWRWACLCFSTQSACKSKLHTQQTADAVAAELLGEGVGRGGGSKLRRNVGTTPRHCTAQQYQQHRPRQPHQYQSQQKQQQQQQAHGVHCRTPHHLTPNKQDCLGEDSDGDISLGRARSTGDETFDESFGLPCSHSPQQDELQSLQSLQTGAIELVARAQGSDGVASEEASSETADAPATCANVSVIESTGAPLATHEVVTTASAKTHEARMPNAESVVVGAWSSSSEWCFAVPPVQRGPVVSADDTAAHQIAALMQEVTVLRARMAALENREPSSPSRTNRPTDLAR